MLFLEAGDIEALRGAPAGEPPAGFQLAGLRLVAQRVIDVGLEFADELEAA